MPSHEERKKAIQAYKEKEEVGGLIRYVNRANNWESPLTAIPNLQGAENHLAFSKKTNSCPNTMLKAKWAEYGPDGFELVVVEKLAKKPEHTTKEFREELADLLALWEEKEQQ